MAITYTWKVTSLKVKNEVIDDVTYENSVCQTYWEKIGTDENGNVGSFHGATPFTLDPTDDSGPFIAFEDLTEADILGWIQGVVVDSYEEHVNAQIQKQIDQKVNPITEPALPWVITEEAAVEPDPSA